MHGVAADLAEAAALALRAGVDIDLMGNAYARGLPGALERGRVTMAEIDAAVRRILALKAALGLFDDPLSARPGSSAAAQLRAHREARPRGRAPRDRAAHQPRATCCRSRARRRRIAVLGPLADARADMLGPWAAGGRAEDMVTMLEGLRAALPGARDQACAGRRDRRRRCQRHRGGARSRARGRGRGAVPRRGARDERRGGEPRPARPARPPAGAGAGGARPRQAGRRDPVVRAAR